MEWVKPDFEEVSLNCEINCYCSAEIERTQANIRNRRSAMTTLRLSCAALALCLCALPAAAQSGDPKPESQAKPPAQARWDGPGAGTHLGPWQYVPAREWGDVRLGCR